MSRGVSEHQSRAARSHQQHATVSDSSRNTWLLNVDALCALLLVRRQQRALHSGSHISDC